MIRSSAVLGALVTGAVLVGGIVSAGVAQAQGSGSVTLDAVRARGQVICGVGGTVAGFSLPDSQGVMRGLDADGCRAVAAAALGDASKVKFVPLTTQNRFTALQSGEVDMLARTTTWTLGREANLGALFAGVNFYDGTGFLVKKSSGVKSLTEMDGATICVQSGTSTELAIADWYRVHNMKFTPILMEAQPEVEAAFMSGRCNSFSDDSSQLATFRAVQPNRDDFVLLPELVSKEPLAYMVRKGDDKWFDLVRWTHFAQLNAEEEGVTSKNVDQMLTSSAPDIRRLLGVEGDMGKALGVDNKWGYNIIKQVGNFGEMWDRNMTPLGVARGLNALWNKGGLQYAPPIL